MTVEQLAAELTKAAVSGVSKTQVASFFKKTHNIDDVEFKNFLKICNFKAKPSRIDYKYFYNLPVTQKTKRLAYPFTQIYICKNFLSPGTCQALMNLVDSRLRPSTVSNPTDDSIVSDYRTSQTADLNFFESDALMKLDQLITDYVGIKPYLGETLQSQKYNPGEYYKEHCDFFFPLSKEFKTYTEWMGQRTWTFMCYLNDVEEGGETYFKHLNLKIKPKQGTAVIWNNLYKSGLPNPKTLHEALPPISGNKYVITKWFRSWPLI